ncbi:stage II sporulation protein M [Candidatus Pacearchaeota archaeon]|nr:stage II sporulation protein M [Candidatus Pacearchaeota archaeon]
MKVIKTKKSKSCKKHYSEVFNFIKDSRKPIYWIIAIFFIFAFVSFFLPVPSELVEIINKVIQDMLESTLGLSAFDLIKYIFLNNLAVSFIGIIFGILLGILPIILSLINGYIVGYVAKLVVDTGGVLSLWRLFPHGIFELPAIFISLGIGLKLAGSLFSSEADKTFLIRLKLAIKTFFLLILPLLFIAAIIEGLLIVLLG